MTSKTPYTDKVGLKRKDIVDFPTGYKSKYHNRQTKES